MKKILVTLLFFISVMVASSCSAATSMQFKVLGINGELLAKVTAQLQLKQATITTNNDEAIKTFYREIPQEIVKTLELYGYFKSTVTGDVPKRDKKGKWKCTFMVNLGQPIRIIKIDLAILGAGAANKEFRQRLKNFPLNKGDVFLADKYNAAKNFLFDLADTYGYMAAFLAVKEVRINLKNNTAEIILHFATGAQYYFGDTTFVVPFFSKTFLAKFLPYQAGELYSDKKLYALQEILNGSNFFQKIAIKPQPTKNQSRAVPVQVTLIPRKAKQYNFGAGFGTDTGLRGSLGMELRHLTPWGQGFKAVLQGSQVQNNLELHYLIPGQHPATDLYDFNLAGEALDLSNGKSLAGKAGVGYMTILRGWHQTIKLSLQHEHYQLTGQPYESSTLLVPSINWLHSASDDPIKPTTGHAINVNIQGASKYFVATSNFLQAQVDAKYMATPFTHTQLILHAILGYTAINNVNNLPLSLQFYTGGTQSIRGFGYDTIGPGRNLAVGSIELRQRIVDDWYIAAFFDAGNANNKVFAKPNQGAGCGIVWRTGIGTLELTYAKAISQAGAPGMIQFSLAPDL